MARKIEMEDIAIDIGYGDVKVAYKDKYFKFSTAVARKREAFVEMDNAVDSDVYDFNGNKFVVGDRAISTALPTRGVDFLLRYGPLLVYVACKKAGVDTTKPIRIATGLSIMNWNERMKFYAALETIHVNGETITPEAIAIYAQGQGILKDSGITAQRVAVVDIGYNTLDFLYFENGVPNKEEMYATEGGVNKIVTNIQSFISSNFSLQVSEQGSKIALLDRGFTVAGDFKSLEGYIDDQIQQYSEDTLAVILNKKRNLILSETDKVVFSGGGANYISSKVDGWYEKLYVYSKQPFEFSNVRGYLALLAEVKDA